MEPFLSPTRTSAISLWTEAGINIISCTNICPPHLLTTLSTEKTDHTFAHLVHILLGGADVFLGVVLRLPLLLDC